MSQEIPADRSSTLSASWPLLGQAAAPLSLSVFLHLLDLLEGLREEVCVKSRLQGQAQSGPQIRFTSLRLSKPWPHRVRTDPKEAESWNYLRGGRGDTLYK